MPFTLTLSYELTASRTRSPSLHDPEKLKDLSKAELAWTVDPALDPVTASMACLSLRALR